MIFVTVGTHEQSFVRLLKTVDNLRGAGHIRDTVFMQTGHTPYEPRHCGARDFLPFQVMERLFGRSRIVITHGGDCVMQVLRHGKIPIVTPRLRKYGEHVDDHQLQFALHLSKLELAVLCLEPDGLLEAIRQWEVLSCATRPQALTRDHALRFAAEVEQICLNLVNYPGSRPEHSLKFSEQRG